MQLIIQIIALAGIYVGVGWFRYKTEHNYEFDLNCCNIRLHKGYLWLGLILTVVEVGMSLWTYLDGSEGVSLIFFILSLLSSLLIFAYLGFRITFDDEKLAYRRFFEKPKTIYFKDIREIRCGLDIEIQTKTQKLVIPNYMTNTAALMVKMMPYLPKKKKIKTVPRVRRFRDSVERAGEFIFAFALLDVALLGVFIWVNIAQKFDPTTFYVLGGLLIFINGVFFLMVHSAKRAHSSRFWGKIAKLFYKEGYLKD